MLVLLGSYLLSLAIRRRSLAETWVGIFFVTTGAGGECFLLAFSRQTEPALAMRLAWVGFPLLLVATFTGFAFTYTVFRRGEWWALVVVGSGTLFALWGTWQQLGGFSLEPDLSQPRMEYLAGRIACFAWGTFEGLRAYVMARRRLALGLSDPVVVNRFFLFGCWFAMMGLMPITFMAARWATRTFGLESALELPPKLVALAMIVALVLTFFPPRGYLNWLRSSAQRGAS
jgi:hypothetical protein